VSAANPVLVEVWRGAAVESRHRGAYVVLDGAGGQVAAAGDVQRPVFPRSAVKLLQALPLVASGAADALGPDVMPSWRWPAPRTTASPEHVRPPPACWPRPVWTPDVLECGAHWPYLDTAPARAGAAGRAALRAAQQLLGQARRLRLPGLRTWPAGAGLASCAATWSPGTP
jgi:L-asparaginase II